MRVFVILLAAHAVISATTASVQESSSVRGILTLETRQKRGSDAHISGAFRSENGDGIRFVSSEKSLMVSTMDGSTIMNVSRIAVTVQAYGENDYATVYHILGDEYLESNEKTYRFANKDALFQVHGSRYPLTHTHLLAAIQAEELPNPQPVVQASVQRLIKHPAMKLLKPAAWALGEDMGITGRDEPAALMLYAAAMRFSELLEDDDRETRNANYWENYFNDQASVQRYPNCDLTTCPPCQDDQCMGLCGRRCSCWQIFCGDCCLHKGCESHDVCCRKKGFYSWRCLFPTGLSCGSFRC